MGITRGPNIVTDGLVFAVDAANPSSYVSGSTIWKDQTVNQNDGTLTNGPTFDSGNGGSIVFDGVNDYVNLGNNIDFSNYTNGFTISFWVKVLNTTQLQKYLFSKLVNAGNDNQFSIVYGYVANTFELYAGSVGIGASQNIRLNSQISVNDNNWHFLCYTVGGTTKGYLDNTLKFTNSYGSLTFVSSTQNNLLTSFNTSVRFGNFSISNIKIYNRTLSATEVLQNYNALKERFGL